MTRYEVWADQQATPSFVELTGSPTVARLVYSGTDLEEAQRARDEALRWSLVLAATVREVDEDEG